MRILVGIYVNISSGAIADWPNQRFEVHERFLGKALDVVQKHYSKDLHQVIVYLIFGPNTLNGTNGQLR